LEEIKKSSEKKLIKKDNPKIIKILKKKEVFCGTMQDADIIDSEYCLFVLGKEKFETITYLYLMIRLFHNLYHSLPLFEFLFIPKSLLLIKPLFNFF